MGRVYLANDERLQRQVALKALAPALTADEKNRERLRREARAAAALTHPGICTIYALEAIDDELFIVAEFVEGETLRQESAHSPLPSAADVLRTARDLAAALAHAHAKGVVHRDLKPENVMRTRAGGIKVLDFGLARAQIQGVHGEARMTEPGVIVGTPAYMAPEQLNAETVTASADVFAFGVMMYEYSCGAHPFAAEGALGTMARILERDATPLPQRRPDLPEVFVAVVERCLRKDRAERFASAADIVDALNRSDAARENRQAARWWRMHQIATIAIYTLACALMWQVKEWIPGLPTLLFIGAGVLATVAGVFRGHLLFVEWSNRERLDDERRRAQRITAAADVLLALALVIDGLLLASVRPLMALFCMALGVGLALARLLIEPSTTSASFSCRA
jgi:hypothetical protein